MMRHKQMISVVNPIIHSWFEDIRETVKKQVGEDQMPHYLFIDIYNS